MKMIKRDLLKLFQEWGKEIKMNDGGGEFSYDILQEILQKSECAGRQWLMPIILATQEAEIRRIVV
jgi:hypothetical protein